MNIIGRLKRYVYWKAEYANRPTVFPYWCETGGGAEKGRTDRHRIGPDRSVVWEPCADKRLPHYDHIEMSGFFASAIISYGVNRDGSLRMHRHCVFPMLRKIPNDTAGSLSHNFTGAAMVKISANGRDVDDEYPKKIVIRGSLAIESGTSCGISVERKLLPAVDYPAAIEKIAIKNTGNERIKVELKAPEYLRRTEVNQGASGAYALRAGLADKHGMYRTDSSPSHSIHLEPGGSANFYAVYCGARDNETIAFNVAEEERKRERFIKEMFGSLILETPEEVMNTAFDFAKIRACESIFKTKNGLMHAPGGGSYYAALWTNDQCEYVNPFFPFHGYPTGCGQAVNCYGLYMGRMDPAMGMALVTSIIAEGDGTWNGAGDRGDGAMFAYGAARFALAYGDAAVAEKLWGGIVWAIEYSLKKKNAQGVICSDSDELENRFESGEANLFTSSLLYDALVSAAYLGRELGKPQETLERYRREAAALRSSIEAYFGSRMDGFETYRYYEGNTALRAWICIPLAMGIFDRAEGTVSALFSDRLWTDDGLRTEAGKETFWDRATLYALRGVFAAGSADAALKHLEDYSRRRLLGEHVPYPIEAWPEGNQRHLAAESGLYARIFTEGLFGIRPTGFQSFDLNPRLPSGWKNMALKKVRAFRSSFDIEVYRDNEAVKVRVSEGPAVVCDMALGQNGPVHVTLPTKKPGRID